MDNSQDETKWFLYLSFTSKTSPLLRSPIFGPKHQTSLYGSRPETKSLSSSELSYLQNFTVYTTALCIHRFKYVKII